MGKPKHYRTNLQPILIDLLRLGYTDKQIAERLDVTPKHVRNQLSVMYKQHDFKNRTDAAMKGLPCQNSKL